MTRDRSSTMVDSGMQELPSPVRMKLAHLRPAAAVGLHEGPHEPPSSSPSTPCAQGAQLRRVVEAHTEQLAHIRLEVAALRDCLEQVGIPKERVLARIHARRFADILRVYPVGHQQTLAGVIEAAPPLRCIAAGAGLSTTRTLRVACSPICRTAAALAPDLGVPPYGAGFAAVCAGGFNGSQCLDHVEYFDACVGAWAAMPPMNERRAGAAAGELFGKAYVFGGSNDDQCLNSVECLDMQLGMWEPLPPMSDRRDGAAAVGMGEHIYVFGGYNGLHFLASAERYHPSSRTWEPLPHMAERRYRGSAAVLGGKIYVLGGSDDVSCLGRAQRFDPATQAWEAVPPMEARRDGAAVAVLNGLLLVIGGHDGRQYLNSAERFDPDAGEWAPLPPLNERRYRAAAVVLMGEVFVLGGYSGRAYLNSAECLSSETGLWEDAPPMQTRRGWVAAVRVDRCVAGGDLPAGHGPLPPALGCYDALGQPGFGCSHAAWT